MLILFGWLSSHCSVAQALCFLEDPILIKLQGPCNSIDFVFLSRQKVRDQENFIKSLEAEGNFSCIHPIVLQGLDYLHWVIEHWVRMELEASQGIQVMLLCWLVYLCWHSKSESGYYIHSPIFLPWKVSFELISVYFEILFPVLDYFAQVNHDWTPVLNFNFRVSQLLFWTNLKLFYYRFQLC